jgi:magnesium transporter
MDTSSSLVAQAGARARPREVEYSGLVWVDIPQPAASDLAMLRERFGYDALPLEQALAPVRRPRLDVYTAREYLYAELHIPAFDEAGALVPVEVGVFAGRGAVVTLHDGSLKPIRRLVDAAARDETARAQLLGRGPGYLLFRIVTALIQQVFPVLYQVDEALAQADRDARNAAPLAALRTLDDIRRDLAALRTIILPNRAVVEGLRGLHADFLRLHTGHFFADGAQLAAKIEDLLQEQADLAASLGATIDSMVAYRTGQQLRLITGLLIILLPLALVAALAGLNAAVPLAGQPVLFFAAALATAAAIIGALAFARYRQWL